jgi:hypothetical protein
MVAAHFLATLTRNPLGTVTITRGKVIKSVLFDMKPPFALQFTRNSNNNPGSTVIYHMSRIGKDDEKRPKKSALSCEATPSSPH